MPIADTTKNPKNRRFEDISFILAQYSWYFSRLFLDGSLYLEK